MTISTRICRNFTLASYSGGEAYGAEVMPTVPEFDTAPKNITAIAGETISLPCSIEYKNEYKDTMKIYPRSATIKTCSPPLATRGRVQKQETRKRPAKRPAPFHLVIWMNPRKTLISTDDSRYIDDSRLSVERPKIEDWNLMIREVRHNDSGEYMCQINTKPVKIKRIHLFVLVPPEIIEDWTGSTIKVLEGATVELVCNATGVPIPVVTWFRQADSLMDYTSTDYGDSQLVGEVLILRNISRYCDGLYECNADNGVIPSATKSFEVIVEFKPEVRVATPRLGQTIGRETILECRVSSSPHAIMMWKKNGSEVPIHLYKYSTVIYDEDDKHEKTLALHIIDIDRSDYGYYTCMASNGLGSDEETMLLYESRSWNSKRTTTTTALSTRKYRPPSHTSPYFTVRPVSSFYRPGQGRNGGGGYYNYHSDASHLVISEELFSLVLLTMLLYCTSLNL